MKTLFCKTCLIVLLVLNAFKSNAQSDSLKIDSLKKVLLTQKEDTNKVNTLNELANKLRDEKDYKNSLPYAKEALSLSEKMNFIKGKGSACYTIGNIYTYNGEYNNHEGLKYFLAALETWNESENRNEIAKAHYDIANIYGSQGNYPEAIKNLYSALKLFEQLKNKKQISTCLYYIGIAYSAQGDHTEALKNEYKALNTFQETKDKRWTADTYSVIGEEYFILGNYSAALQKNLSALNIYKEMGEKAPAWGLPSCYEGIGNVYEKQGELEYKNGEKVFAEAKYIDALKNYLISLKMWEANNTLEGVAACEISIGNLYIKQKKIAEAKNYLEKGLQLSRTINSKEIIKNSYKGLSDLDSSQQNFKQAYEHYKMYILYRDSLVNQEATKKLVQLKMQYAFDKKEAFAKASQEKRDGESRRIKNQQYFTIAGLSLVVLAVIIIALIQFRNNKHKQQANLALQHQKEKVESTLQVLKSTQSQLIQSEKMASLGELTSGIAHEIQNPLNFVTNFSELNKEMLEELKTERLKPKAEQVDNTQDEIIKDVIENSEKINHHGKRADAIVKGMLQHSRSGSGVKEPTDINALCDEYLRLSYQGVRAKNSQNVANKSFNATIKTDFDESIGKINIIPQDIGRVLLNLYNNAFYAVNEMNITQNQEGFKNPPGLKYEPTVSVTTKKSENHVIITVSDNGNGIPQNIVDKIFQPFFTTKPTGQGTGLGLSLSYDIVKAQGGDIKVESNIDKGSKFIIQLPLNRL